MPADRVYEPLSFVEIVEREFAFLTEAGFRSTVEGENSVSYERPDGLFVRVFRDARDKYVGFRVGQVGRPKDALTATELARLAGVTTPRSENPERSDQLAASVAIVAHELQTYGQRILSGDESIFVEAMELRRTYTNPYTGKGPNG
jgi:hypothetical protein